MALSWRLVALVGALLAALVAVLVRSRTPPSKECPWGDQFVLRSASGMHLEAVGSGAVLRPPALREEALWRIVKSGGRIVLKGAGGSLQDNTGKVALGSDAKTNAALWWAKAKGDAIKLQSSRQMYLVADGGELRMTESEDEADRSLWQVLNLEGPFPQRCWPQKRQDAALNDGWLTPQQQTPDQVPQPSDLANYSWKPFHNVTEEEVRHYDEHGWVLLRQVVEPEIMDRLYREAEAFCSSQIARRNVCQIEMLRWQLNTFRDFLFYGPLGPTVHRFVRGSGVRVSTEALFGTVFNEVDPHFFSYQYHTDAGNQFGVFHGFNSGTPAAAVWFPLHDVDAEVTGGGIKVVDGYPGSECKWRNCGGMLIARGPQAPKEYNCPSDCWNRFGWRDCGSNGCKNSVAQRILSFKKGDIVVWHSDMPHATQSTKQHGFSRYAFTVRFVDSDAVMCDVAGSCGGWMACCKDTPRVSGQKVHSYCYPQLAPKVLDHEVQAHYSSTPKFVIADRATEERIQRTPPSRECDRPANAKADYD